MRQKSPLILLLLLAFTFGPECRVLAYQQIPDYLCDQGARLMDQGKYEEALADFQKALIVEPGFTRAQRYIELIRSKMAAEEVVVAATGVSDALEERSSAIDSMLDIMEKAGYKRQPKARAIAATSAPVPAGSVDQPAVASGRSKKAVTAPAPLQVVYTLDKSIESARFPFEVEKNTVILIKGENIARYIVTQPEVLRADKLSPDELALTVTDFGYTYLHVWDARQRWTLEFLGTPERPKGPTLDEELLAEEERSRAFRLRYTLDWNEYSTGPHLNDQRRSSYAWNHSLTIEGQSPYGTIDSSVNVRDITSSTDVTYYTLGLRDGILGAFQGFEARVFDFYPNITNLAFSGGTYRGAYLQSPAFNGHLNYTVFWGQQAGGRYGFLSPGLNANPNYYMQGAAIAWLPSPGNMYQFSTFHSYGEDRPDNAASNSFDLRATQGFGEHWRGNYETGYDSQKFSHLASASYLATDLKSTLELRDTSKQFKTMTGTGWRAGEIGALSATSWQATDKLAIGNRLDVYQDRLFPNPEHTGRLNEDWSVDANYIQNEYTSFRGDYSLSNDVGKDSPLRSHNAGVGYYQAFDLWTRLNTYLTYRHIDTRYINSNTNDYTDDKVILGVNVRLISELFYYLSEEYNWLNARESGTRTNPNAFETGFDWATGIFSSPFFVDLRLTYRNEEDAISPVGFLSGEDYIEYYGELAYRPRPDFEMFYSARVRNIIAVENPSSRKRIDVNMYAGLRYNWDTGFTWDPVGEIMGQVFIDTNGDGLREESEKPMQGIKILLGKQALLTNPDGYYYFGGVKARRTTVMLDASTLPAGYVLTTPQVQQIDIRHGKVSTADFGIVSRTEISGYVFVDVNNNKKYDRGDKGKKGVVVTLENGSKAITDDNGHYVFRQAGAGTHKLTLDLATLPPAFLPSVPVFADIELTEGSTYVYNFPLKQIAEE